jgi:hypothetical protein
MVLAHNKTGRNSGKDKGLVFAVRSIGPLSASDLTCNYTATRSIFSITTTNHAPFVVIQTRSHGYTHTDGYNQIHGLGVRCLQSTSLVPRSICLLSFEPLHSELFITFYLSKLVTIWNCNTPPQLRITELANVQRDNWKVCCSTICFPFLIPHFYLLKSSNHTFINSQ